MLNRTTRVAASSRTLAMPRTRTHTSVTARDVVHTLVAPLAPLSFVFALLFSLAARAELSDVQRLENKITSSAATKIYLNGGSVVSTNTLPDGAEFDNLVFVFTNASNTLTLDPSVRANARILLVGGGGAGGSGGGDNNNHGAGGGGGAGGYLEIPSMALPGGNYDYTITVGQGGVAKAAESIQAGGNGGSSLIATNGVTLAVDGTALEAFGGGGGGAECAGVGGAGIGSGGGGSFKYNANVQPGGVCTTGQGCDGGSGATFNRTAGGGGGAMYSGAPAAKNNVGAAGGDGKECDITGIAVAYAGGGGSGTKGASAANIGFGGAGGGGNGAGGSSDAKSGKDGFGGGGGGGSLTTAGANGGCGTVIVRITQLVEAKVAVPTVDDKVYNGEEQFALELGIKYSYDSGTLSATNVDEYVLYVKPGPDLEWIDGGTDSRPVTWKIVAREIVKPVVVDGLGFQEGVNQIGVTVDDDSSNFFTFSAGSVTNATNAGTYPYTVSLKDSVNTIWADGTAGDISGTWTIAPVKVARPTPAALAFTYDNTAKSVFASLPELDTRYSIESGVVSATEGGSYSFSLALIGNDEAVNYVWADTETADPYDGSWTIAPAVNSITPPVLTGWRIGATPNEPTATPTWGEEADIVYTYGFGSSADEISDWLDDPAQIAEEGTWVVKAVIPATANWTTASSTATFVVWSDPAELFHNTVEISIKGSTVELSDFIVPVRISESRMPGFLYDAADSSKLVFVDKFGNLLSYDVDTWNTDGESVVWLKIPTLPTDGTTVTMYWNLRDGQTAPVNDAATVWSAYAGVWHMGGGSINPTRDSTGNANAATIGSASSSTNGVVGGALKSTSNSNGPILKIPASDAVNGLTNAAFTASFWAKIGYNASGKTGWPVLFARRSAHGGYGYGVRIASDTINQTAGTTIRVYAGGSSGYYTWNNDKRIAVEKWQRYDVMYKPGRVELYIDGVFQGASYTGLSAWTDYGYLSLGGWGGGSDALVGAVDEFRIRSGEIDTTLIAAERTYQSDSSMVTSGDVYLDGLRVDYWVEEPAFEYPDMLSWDVDPAKNVDADGNAITNKIATIGELRYGEVTNYFCSAYDPTKVYSSLDEITEAGLYYAVFERIATEGFQPLEKTIAFSLVSSKPYNDIVGNGGDSGRVLLMNNHIGESGHPDVDYQGWYDADNAGAKKSDTPTYWHHENLTAPVGDGTTTWNLMDGTASTLFAADGRRLWHLANCRHGNTFPQRLNISLAPTQNYLPWRATYSKTIKTGRSAKGTQTAANRMTVGQLVMQNLGDFNDDSDLACAAVYSPCFTNGIGTIYFDAVNGWCRKDYFTQDVVEDFENYRIVVEIATETTEGLEPTDANSFTESSETDSDTGVTVVTTNWYGRLAGKWTQVPFRPFLHSASGFTPVIEKSTSNQEGTTNMFALAVATGGAMDDFYRIVVPLDISGPVRFRIRRVSSVPSTSFGVDAGGFILVDNIIASIPADRADLVSSGHYDAEKTGSRILGWELQTSVPYPSVSDAAIKGSAAPVYQVHSSADATSGFFSSAVMHYRWRYLNQSTGDWKTVDLNPSDGFRALAPFDLPSGRVGDVEYWYEYSLQAPYYKYVDYSGAGSIAASDYTEERGTVTNRLDGVTVPTGGSDWFFRLREGKSDNAGLDIVFSRGDSAELERVHMMLGEDHVWRGFVQTKENQTGEMKYRVEVLDARTESYSDYVATTNYWYCQADCPRFPVSDSLQVGSADSWSRLVLDATTGYVMFQVDDSTKALTIVHADYQNANGWTDALGRADPQGRSPIFVGTSTTNAYKIGVSPSKQTFTENFSEWGSMPATNETWTFPTGLTDIQPNHMLGRATYATFSSDTNGLWDVGQGMWIAQKYRDDRENAGVALQMAGYGRGYLQFTDSAKAPRGLESISFNARLTQEVAFEDFAYYFGGSEGMLGLSNYTFTARTAFDLNANKNFRGNASLSLVANYLPNRGCYEARWEWLGNNSSAKRGQRLCLYRWNVVNGLKVPTLIVARTNTVFDVEAVTALENSSSQRFTPLFISVSNDVPNNCTIVIAGVRRCGVQLGTSPIGTSAANKEGGRNENWFGVCFKDTDRSKRLPMGTYGVLSANCPGVFALPEFSHTVQASVGTFPSGGKTVDSFENASLPQVSSLQNVKNCAKDDLQNTDFPGWNIVEGRHSVTYTSDVVNAVTGSAPAQELQIFLGTAGRGDWGSTPYKTIVVDGFGGATTNIPLYTTKDCSVRFATGNGISDVAVDSVTLRQWRGGNWNDSDVWPLLPAWADDAHRGTPVGHTNFVFTSAWVTNGTVLLSAKRAKLDEPSSIRSPLMDGFADDGTGGSGYVRGKGLGMISIAYANAQENANLALQILTNGVDHNTIGGYDKTFSGWTTVTNFDFSAMSKDQRRAGILNSYLGLHDVKGAMRIVVSTNAVENAASVEDTSRFGDVTIVSIACSDEPAVDVHSWWGWNLRTVGGDADDEKRMLLDDYSAVAGGSGLSVALNNSVDENFDISRIDVTDRESYIRHKPFVQTPTFTSNIVGEVVFKARKYSSADQPATVTIYGSRNASETDEGKWDRIDGGVFMVTNDWYETYRCKMDSRYKAFRLAVAGVYGIDETSDGGGNGLPDGAYDPPPRVLIDEMYVCEAINATMGFKGVGCFRHDMSGLGEVPHVPSKGEQPICGESWGVQCEIYGAQLASDIDFSHTPRVKLHWFDGIYPWGFENWKDSPSAHSAWLSRAIETEEDRYVYRSCMRTSPDAVVPMSTVAPSYVQYMLEVVFYTKENPTTPVTNWLGSADWDVPEWYSPLDLNARYGSDGSFAAYNILDNVAPDWAWINEVNIFGDFVRWSNTDDNCQFVEIAHPPEADVSGWSVRLLEGQSGNDWVVTNVLARFGRDGLSGTKQMSSEDAEANMVFRVIGSPLSRSSGRLKKSDGTLDAVWNVDNPTLVFTSDGVISYYDPVVFQLVRASGVVEHEIIVEGTNYLESLEIEPPDYIREVRDFVTNKLQKSTIVIPGYDYGGPSNSLSVIQNFGHNGMEEPENDWINTVRMTPGHRNIGQVIDPNHPVPAGEEVLVYFTVTGDHIQQSLDGSNFTNGMFSAIVTKGNPVGTNVIYRVDPWYVLGSVRTGNVSLAGQVRQTKATQPFEYELAGVAKGVSNNVTVVASAALNPRFGADWGVPENDPYRDAIVEWLKGGTDLYGNPFADVESGEIRLATHRSWWSGSVLTNLTLKEMYWLDMDPTIGNLTLLAGTAFDPGGIEHVVTRELGDSTVVLTNRRLYVYMMISNENEVVAAPAHRRGVNDFTTHWTPYVLRGVSPGESSQEYVASTGDWSSVTFKITGMLMNGYTSFGNVDNKVPLRHFVFNENSFSAEGLSKVEVYDPYSPLSIGYNAGWKRWWDRHGHCPVVFFWMIDTRLPPVGVEQLKEDNYYGD